MLNSAEEIIKFIGDAKKQTIVKVYLKGENLPEATDFKMFGGDESKVCIGNLDVIKAYMEANENIITDFYLEQDRRNSAIPLLDVTNINARIEPGALIRDHVKIGNNAVIMMGAIMIDMGAVLGGRVEVGKRCHVGAGAVLAGVIEPPSATPVILEDDVLIGANAVVIEGVRIGKGAVVGAGAIVRQDVPAGAVVVGNPARIIKQQKDEKTDSKTQLMDDLRKL